ncbi:cadmium/zinc-transporting ATPase 3-like protein [Corchorus olitorius]|uniref:Cadmium/zinc-transporting ATPase 3-like protein n=1 Tax=Corchorus olitorius TaxID=93759 RepID=A0A1R3JK88_9ROSI|nr:cadmium/zinc-transporting ATPase 3-like protein [Corchorus olitorius]
MCEDVSVWKKNESLPRGSERVRYFFVRSVVVRFKSLLDERWDCEQCEKIQSEDSSAECVREQVVNQCEERNQRERSCCINSRMRVRGCWEWEQPFDVLATKASPW